MAIRSIELHKDAKRVDLDLYDIDTGKRGLMRVHMNGLVELHIEGHTKEYSTNIERLIDYIYTADTKAGDVT